MYNGKYSISVQGMFLLWSSSANSNTSRYEEVRCYHDYRKTTTRTTTSWEYDDVKPLFQAPGSWYQYEVSMWRRLSQR
jgi:hypothetical protein